MSNLIYTDQLTAKQERHTILVTRLRDAHSILGCDYAAYARSMAALDLVLHVPSVPSRRVAHQIDVHDFVPYRYV
ncbi:MAG: hypothetical protein E6Q97_22015 [Desulfurellales bacterium]|nr:MAG: hypothetical protein E6Q97_22015 [Desulfurellales bacterium]